MVELLELERIDRDLYRAVPGPPAGLEGAKHLFGGQVAAQAMRAAIHTVDPDRPPHSLHGYFLRTGDDTRPVLLEVHRDRDGRSFSARRVVARQEGEVIFSLAASFHVEEESDEYQRPMPHDVPDPDDVEPRTIDLLGPTGLFDLRYPAPDGSGGTVEMPARMWGRTREALPDDDAVHACALVYMSDFGSGFGEVDLPDLAKVGPSLDHTVWFHRPVRLDDWVLLDMWPLRASRAVGTYAGTIHDRAGTCAAAITQEALLRVPTRLRGNQVAG
jgi:acyl-CoA thioesterase-2